MTYVKIGDLTFPATVSGRVVDRDWNNRESKSITIKIGCSDALSLFVDDLPWFIVYQPEPIVNERGETITPEPEIYDNSEYCVAGSVTDHRNGTVTVKMGKITAEEALAELMEVLA